MERFLGAYSSYTSTLVMRIVVGLLFACHGAQKLFGVLGGVNQRGASAPLLSSFGFGRNHRIRGLGCSSRWGS